ncbi:MAG: Uma2 family endonuclease [Planctomycetaceae bacterium]
MVAATLPPMEAQRLRLGPDDAGRRLTRAEYADADYAEPYKYERVHGRLVVMSPAGPEHRFVSRPFRRKLCTFWEEHLSLVEDVAVEGWVATSPDDDRLPDICVYFVGDDSQHRVPDRVPAMIFEFVSQSRSDQKRDYIHKRDEYRAIGAKEYVIVDRFKRLVLVLRWQPDGYAEHTLTEHDFYSTPLLPDLVIPLSEAFTDVTE